MPASFAPRGAYAACVVLLGMVPPGVEAQRPSFLGFRGDMGIDVPHGDAGDVFQGNVRGEFSIIVGPRRWPIYGVAGQGWVSYPVHAGFGVVSGDEEYETEFWNHVTMHLGVGVNLDRWLQLFPLYVEVRWMPMRLRQLRARDWLDTPSPEQNPYKEFDDSGFGLMMGIHRPMAARTWIDASARVSQFRPKGDFSGQGFNLNVIKEAWTFGIQLGLVWFP